MKTASVIKCADQSPVTQEQLAQINRYSRRELTAQEVYVFSLILCDNEIDRDYERFTSHGLQKLSQLFLGKTGIFDHNPKGENQMSRIFATQVVEDTSRVTQTGEPYCALKAWAYMVRCEKNADLILEIDAGIKKEVSVGCSVERTECSVCGADIRAGACSHVVGKEYDGMLCHRILINPTDAYEWSFVAVPAQMSAGVVKGRLPSSSVPEGDLLKALDGSRDVTLTKGQVQRLKDHIHSLEGLAQAGEEHLLYLRKKAVAMSALALPGLDSKLVEEMVSPMDLAHLKKYVDGVCHAANQTLGLQTQFSSEIQGAPSQAVYDNHEFLI